MPNTQEPNSEGLFKVNETVKNLMVGIMTRAVAEATLTKGIEELFTMDAQRATDRNVGYANGKIAGIMEVLGLVLSQEEISKLLEPFYERISPERTNESAPQEGKES